MGVFTKDINNLRETFNSGKTKSIKFRKKQLEALLKMYSENGQEIAEALHKDLRKPKLESILWEVNVLIKDIQCTINSIDQWTQPEKVSKSSVIYNDPLGVVLIMGAWNYPVNITLLPLSGAMAAGNCVMIKPSEVSAHSSKLIEKLVVKYLDQECYKVVQGGIHETTELLKEKFDYIFFTGSTQIGKIVREAANKHLTPTTLELGGKNPVYIDSKLSTANMNLAVERIMWAKCLNGGQTCIAPDYVLCTKEVQTKFIHKTKQILKEWYGEDVQKSPDLTRIINDKNYNRVVEYLKYGDIAIGGHHDATEKYIEPTILVNVSPKSKVMTEELFGPILPIINIDSASDAIQFINNRDKPLAFYPFTENSELADIFMDEITCGGVCINDCMTHHSEDRLPFGGVGSSGMGAYHGKFTFDTFTHKKSCMRRNFNSIADKVVRQRHPPYSDGKIRFFTHLLKDRRLNFGGLKNILTFAVGALSVYVGQQIYKVIELGL